MDAIRLRHIKSGTEYNHLFPGAKGNVYTIKRDASLSDTLNYIPKVVHQSLAQTKKLATLLKQKSVYDTCRNIWEFVYNQIQYKKDKPGYEQIRSPARTWHDRKQGVDCDCYSVFISSILVNLGIPHILRITKYKQDHFQHIYPVVPYRGKEIILDCVTDQFDYEVPYSAKKDYPMDLQFLDGVPSLYTDANDIYLMGMDGDGMEELGKLIKKSIAAKKLAMLPVKRQNKVVNKIPAKKAGLFQKVRAQIETAQANAPAPKPKKKGIFKKVLNVVNKINPATVLLRNGVLAAMKLNVKNVAARLRWSYLTPEQAAARNIDPNKFQKLVATRQKLEKIFYGAGGKEANLKKAILGGKGNKDKAVSGLGMLPIIEWSGFMNETTPLEQLLGSEIYYSENIEGMEGFRGLGELGEPVTLASVGAAMGVLAGIVAALKQIGDIFKSKSPGSGDFDEEKTDAPENNVATTTAATVAENVPAQAVPFNPIQEEAADNFEKSTPGNFSTNEIVPSGSSFNQESNLIPSDDEDELPAPNNQTNTGSSGKPNNSITPDKESFWEKNKTWLKPVAIGAGGLTLIAIGFKMFGNKPQSRSSPSYSLSGFSHKKKKKNHKRKQKIHHQRKKAVALL